MKIKNLKTSTLILLLTAFVVIAWANQANAIPIINSVSTISNQQIQTININGSGFGTSNPYTGDTSFIRLEDETKFWGAGYTGPCSLGGCFDAVTLIVSSWTDSQIVLGGFSGAWGANNWTLDNGNFERIIIGNPQAGTPIRTSTDALSSNAAAFCTIIGVGPTPCSPVPEPGTLTLFAIGLVGLLTSIGFRIAKCPSA